MNFPVWAKTLRAYGLYGGIAACGAALGWPEHAALDWRFWITVTVSVLTAWKALGTTGPREEPQPVMVTNPPENPVNTTKALS